MQTPSLLEQFVRDECNDHVRGLLNEALASGKTQATVKRFEFNRFEVALDFEALTATVEDVLDASDDGVQEISLSDFFSAVNREDV
jgi:hypothetical protein